MIYSFIHYHYITYISYNRFAPVKKCSDLLLLRSDAYIVNPSHVLTLNTPTNTHNINNNNAPIIDLDDKKYKLVQHLDSATRNGYPSLIHCKKLLVKGEIYFTSRHIFKGKLRLIRLIYLRLILYLYEYLFMYYI